MFVRTGLRPAVVLCASSILTLGALVACSAGSTSKGEDTSGDDGNDGVGSGDGDSGLVDLDDDVPRDGDTNVMVDPTMEDPADEEPDICEEYQTETERIEPVVMLLLDQSGSMAEPRWSHATEALETSAANLETFAQVGFIGFPTHPISSVDVYEESCGAELKVAPGGAGVAAQISASLNPMAPNRGHTPIRAAIDLAGSEFAKPEYATKAKYVVLITDGQPNCASSNIGSFWQTEDPSDAVAALKEQGITTFVVGYDLPPAGVEPANNMAMAGGTDAFKSVLNGDELSAELELIRQQIVPCDFELNEPPAGGAEYVRVTIDGTDYALDDAWTLEGEKTISLTVGGPACNVIRDGADHVTKIVVECEPVVVVVR